MSINNISFLDQYTTSSTLVVYSTHQEILPLWDQQDIQILLDELEKGKTYLISIEFTLSWLKYSTLERHPYIGLSKPILITNKSNSELISNFIYQQIRLVCDDYLLDDSILENLGTNNGPGVVIAYAEIDLV